MALTRDEMLERQRERYAVNRERERKRNQGYRKAHPETGRARALKWLHKNKDNPELREKRRIANQKSYAKLREKRRQEQAAYYSLHKEEHRSRRDRRRARLNTNALENPSIINQWKNEMRQQSAVRCYWCGTKLPGSDAHFDHVVSIACGGAHSISNLCVSCPPCNLSKQHKPIDQWKKHPQVFLSL